MIYIYIYIQLISYTLQYSTLHLTYAWFPTVGEGLQMGCHRYTDAKPTNRAAAPWASQPHRWEPRSGSRGSSHDVGLSFIFPNQKHVETPRLWDFDWGFLRKIFLKNIHSPSLEHIHRCWLLLHHPQDVGDGTTYYQPTGLFNIPTNHDIPMICWQG